METTKPEEMPLDISHTVNEKYNPQWVEKYETEALLLKDIFSGAIIKIEHIGSTSIPKLSAKPIIDIAVLIKNYETAEQFTEPLKKIGYMFDSSSTERHFFKKGNPTEYHLSICYQSRGNFLPRQLAFRDYLRDHPEAMDAYTKLKEEQLQQDPTGRNSYISGKTDFVNDILQKAGFY